MRLRSLVTILIAMSLVASACADFDNVDAFDDGFDNVDALDDTIGLAVAVLRTPAVDPQADPVVFLQGGPGGVSLAEHGSWQVEAWPDHPLIAERDLILVDQWGTGYCEPSLACDDDREDPENCHDRLVGEGIPIAAYATPENAADIASLRLGAQDPGVAEPREQQPAVSDVPTLLLSGVFDPITPPWLAEFAAEDLRDAAVPDPGAPASCVRPRTLASCRPAGSRETSARRPAVTEGSQMLRVAGLWRYPVKSLGGERLASTPIGELGIPGDRAFGIVDVASGTVLTARREPRLLFATATWHDGEVEITADGQRLDDDAALSRWLDRPVRLVRAGPVGGIYENPEDIVHEADWQSWRGPGDAWHDSGQIRLSLVSMDTLGGWAPQRFRANVLLDDGSGEDALVGHEVALGTARLKVTKRVSRCIMVARAQPDVAADLDVIRTINRERDGCLAIGALVTRSGNVEVGDHLSPSG